jgi:hypothetical protein
LDLPGRAENMSDSKVSMIKLISLANLLCLNIISVYKFCLSYFYA